MAVQLRAKPKNTRAISHALAHHAHQLEPLAGVLAVEFATQLVPLGWTLIQHSTGSQSWSMTNGRVEYHIRARRRPDAPFGWEIAMRDSWFATSDVAVIRTRAEAVRFIARCVNE